MNSRIPILIPMLPGLPTCTPTPPPPVPLAGTARDVAALAGRWEGSYSSAVTGRSGSISFTLSATGDSAFGDVIMIPHGLGRPLQALDRQGPTGAAGTQPQSAVLTISFVRVAGGRVTGRLAPYADPETGAQLSTTFARAPTRAPARRRDTPCRTPPPQRGNRSRSSGRRSRRTAGRDRPPRLPGGAPGTGTHAR